MKTFLNLLKPTKNSFILFLILLLIFPIPYISGTVSKQIVSEPPKNVSYETRDVWSIATVGDMMFQPNFGNWDFPLIEIVFLYIISIFFTKLHNIFKTNKNIEFIKAVFKYSIKEKIFLSVLLFVILAFMRYTNFPYTDIYMYILFAPVILLLSYLTVFPSLFGWFFIFLYLYVLLTLLFYVVLRCKKILHSNKSKK